MKVASLVLATLLCCTFCDAKMQSATYEHNGRKITASWYSEKSCKREGTSGRCADGSLFRDENKTAASWDFAFGQKLRVTNKKTGKSVIVEITDRGPNKKLYKKGRVLDLSKSAFASIADLREGVIEVLIEEVK